MMSFSRASILGLTVVLAATACESKPAEAPKPDPKMATPPPKPPEPAVTLEPAPPLPATPLGLPELKVPADNPLTAEKVALGKILFFDTRLSKDGSAACESCHHHEMGWTDGKALSTKVGGGVNKWHTPTLYNAGYLTAWYWDGRAPTLEKQITAAWKGQMGAEDQAAIAAKLNEVPAYKAHFQRAFSGPATAENIPQALASFVRTLRSGDSAWDKYEKGDKTAVSADAVEGFKVFTAKAQCALCHAPPLYTDFGFHNIGVTVDKDKKPEEGRAGQTKDVSETGAFKTPGLRSVTKSGPFFHDGGTATLDAAVAYMVAGGTKNEHLDKKLRAVKLSKKEMAQLMAFIGALESTETFEKPVVP